jgi:Transmembrane secretion effector
VTPEDGRLTRRVKLVKPLRHRDFRLLWVGQTVSPVGDGLFTVALIWQTLQLSSSPVALGIVAFARSLPRLLLLLLGGAKIPRDRDPMDAIRTQMASIGSSAAGVWSRREQNTKLLTLDALRLRVAGGTRSPVHPPILRGFVVATCGCHPAWSGRRLYIYSHTSAEF